MMHLLGADYFGPAYGPQGQTSTSSGSAFDINNAVNAFTSIMNNIFGRPDLSTEEKTQAIQDVSAQYQAQIAAFTKANQTAMITIGGVLVAGVIGFAIFSRKK